MRVQEAYDFYKESQSTEARSILGEALYYYIKAIIAMHYGTHYYYLEDVIGEAAHKVLQQVDKPRADITDFSNWVYAVTINTCIDKLRQQTQRQEQGLLSNVTESVEYNRIDKLALEKVLSRFSKLDKRIALMIGEGLTLEESALELGISRATLQRKRTKILGRLRTQLGGLR